MRGVCVATKNQQAKVCAGVYKGRAKVCVVMRVRYVNARNVGCQCVAVRANAAVCGHVCTEQVQMCVQTKNHAYDCVWGCVWGVCACVWAVKCPRVGPGGSRSNCRSSKWGWVGRGEVWWVGRCGGTVMCEAEGKVVVVVRKAEGAGRRVVPPVVGGGQRWC